MMMKAEDGKLYAVVTLRDVFERCDEGDLSDMPILSEIKQVYEENAKLRDLVRDMFATFCVVRDAPMSDGEELEHSVRFWKKLDELGIEVDDG